MYYLSLAAATVASLFLAHWSLVHWYYDDHTISSSGGGERFLVVRTRNNGVWTGNEAAPFASGFAVDLRTERFVRVFHSDDDAEHFLTSSSIATGSDGSGDGGSCGSRRMHCRVIDLRHRPAPSAGLVTPGFIDNHCHLLLGGHLLSGVRLRDAQNEQQFREEMRRYMQEASPQPEEWVTGGEWNDRHEGFRGQLPHRSWIDDLTPHNPAFLYRMDGHSVLCNSACLRLANITRHTADPEGGMVVRDEDGEPTGVLKDLAINMVQYLVPPPRTMRALQAGMNYALQHGVTTVFEAGAGPSARIGESWEQVQLFRRARRQGKLKVRVHASVELPTWKRLADAVHRNDEGGDAIDGDDYLHIGCLKEFFDGSLGSSTALMFEPYANTNSEDDDVEDDNDGGDRGLQVKPTEVLLEELTHAEREKLQVAVHAIGDRAIKIVLDVFEQVFRESPHGLKRDRRWRIEHAQVLRPQERERFHQIGAIASMQPAHLLDDSAYVERILGAGSAGVRNMFPIRSLRDSGAQIVFGSDWMVADLNPMVSIYAAVTRASLSHPEGYFAEEESVTVEDSLRFYTVNGARALFMDDKLGQIREGFLADFVLLREDPLSLQGDNLARIKDIETEMTVVGGRVRYVSDHLNSLLPSLRAE